MEQVISGLTQDSRNQIKQLLQKKLVEGPETVEGDRRIVKVERSSTGVREPKEILKSLVNREREEED